MKNEVEWKEVQALHKKLEYFFFKYSKLTNDSSIFFRKLKEELSIKEIRLIASNKEYFGKFYTKQAKKMLRSKSKLHRIFYK